MPEDLTRDDDYRSIILEAVDVCMNYRPQLGQGQGYSLTEFQELYGADPFYKWFGLDDPLMYAAHKAAGGMTSIYRQIGIGCQWVFNRMLQDHLGLTSEQAVWAYTIPGTSRAGRKAKKRTLTLDGRIVVSDVCVEARARVAQWLESASRFLEVPRKNQLSGAVFEVRQGYKSKDSKRQNADIANASHAYKNTYLPVNVVLSLQIDSDISERYVRYGWLLLRGLESGSPLDSTYVFAKEVVGYDLAAFFRRNSQQLAKGVKNVLEKLLGHG